MPKKDIYGRDVSGGKGNDFSGSGYDAPKAPQPTIEFERGKGIEDFKAQMRSGFARPNLFRVDIAGVKTDKAAKYSKQTTTLSNELFSSTNSRCQFIHN